MTVSIHSYGTPWRNFYGRSKGKALKKSQKDRLTNQLGYVSPGPISWEENPERHPINLQKLFNHRNVWLEIGFGSGEHLVYQAKRNPDIGFIGCDPYLNGVAVLLGKIEKEQLTNICIHAGDARHLLDVLPIQSVSKAFLLYPDPWPKKRHHRRRFVTPDYLNPLARVIKQKGIFRVATDVKDYVRQALEEVPKSGFDPVGELQENWHEKWPDWVSTRYEQKALCGGRIPYYLTFERSSLPPRRS